jgi:hypothetical protein
VCGYDGDTVGITPRSRVVDATASVPGGAICVVTRCRVIWGFDAKPAVRPHLHSRLVPLDNLHPLPGGPVDHDRLMAAARPMRPERPQGRWAGHAALPAIGVVRPPGPPRPRSDAVGAGARPERIASTATRRIPVNQHHGRKQAQHDQ